MTEIPEHRIYVCVRVLEEDKREVPVHFRCVPEVYRQDALTEIARLRAAMADAYWSKDLQRVDSILGKALGGEFF